MQVSNCKVIVNGEEYVLKGRGGNMSEKLFVILEVEEIDPGELPSHINHHYKPIDCHHDGECDEELWLQPHRIIPANRLRYGPPSSSRSKWFDENVGWQELPLKSLATYLTLDPPEEKPDLQVLLESAPDCVDQRTRKWVESIIQYLAKRRECDTGT